MIRCRSCRAEFVSSLAPIADLCSECFAASRMSRAEAAIPADGRNAGKPRPLRSSTGYRLNGGSHVPRDYIIELDDGVDPLKPRR